MPSLGGENKSIMHSMYANVSAKTLRPAEAELTPEAPRWEWGALGKRRRHTWGCQRGERPVVSDD